MGWGRTVGFSERKNYGIFQLNKLKVTWIAVRITFSVISSIFTIPAHRGSDFVLLVFHLLLAYRSHKCWKIGFKIFDEQVNADPFVTYSRSVQKLAHKKRINRIGEFAQFGRLQMGKVRIRLCVLVSVAVWKKMHQCPTVRLLMVGAMCANAPFPVLVVSRDAMGPHQLPFATTIECQLLLLVIQSVLNLCSSSHPRYNFQIIKLKWFFLKFVMALARKSFYVRTLHFYEL